MPSSRVRRAHLRALLSLFVPVALLLAGLAVGGASPAAADTSDLNVSASVSGATVTVNWTDVGWWSYEIEANGNLVDEVDYGSSSDEITGLDNGTSYTFTVIGCDWFGNCNDVSDPSNAVTPLGTPPAPTGVTGDASTVSGVGQMTVSWDPSPSVLDVTGYTVTPAGGSPVSLPASTTSYTINGLTAGATTSATVTATNGSGTSPTGSTGSVTVPVVPSAPTSVTAVPGDGEASVAWDAPATNAGLIATYTAEAYVGSTDTGLGCGPFLTSGTASSCTIGGLTNGVAYTFEVRAGRYDGIDSGPWSDPSSSVTPYAPTDVPNAPSGVTAVPEYSSGNGVDVSWSAPSGASSEAIASYTVTASPGGATATVDATHLGAAIRHLTPGTEYTFAVTATNSAGTSASSASSAPVDLGTVPGTPTGVSATSTTLSGVGTAAVTWTAPTSAAYSDPLYNTITCSCGTVVYVAGSSTSATVTGLSVGSGNTFTVKATNSYGDGGTSSASAATTPPIVPSAPSITSVVPADGQASVAWSAPTTNAT